MTNVLPWVEADEENRPEYNKTYLVCTDRGVTALVYLDWDRVNGIAWWDKKTNEMLGGIVTHFMEVIPPRR